VAQGRRDRRWAGRWGKPGRLLSLDAFRGFDIAAMLFVNMTWDREVFHPQFFHVPWNDPRQGATFTDLVFPWFLFIMGCAIPLRFARGEARGGGGPSVLGVGLRRAIVLYLLGVLLTVASGAYDHAAEMDGAAQLEHPATDRRGVLLSRSRSSCLPRWAQVLFVVAVLLGQAGR
jgi:predicted acyltransferase